MSYSEGLAYCAQTKEAHAIGKDTLYLTPRDCIIGSMMPEFKAELMSGEPIDVSYFKGKVTVVNFWFETCPPCIAEIPHFNEIVEELGTEDYNFLAIGRDDKKWVTEFLEKNEWNFDHIGGARELIQETFQIKWGFPTTFVVDRDGVIVECIGGIREAQELISILLNSRQ